MSATEMPNDDKLLVVTYTKITEPSSSQVERFLRTLPQSLMAKNVRFRRKEDKLRHLYGLLLLKKTWKAVCKEDLDLNQLSLTSLNRPYLPGATVDFNIAHAGKIVTCALGYHNRIGVDIELKREIDFNDFRRTMNGNQWNEIQGHPDQFEKFFEYWSIKESVIKADGRGLSIPLEDIIVENQTVTYDHRLWYLKPFTLGKEYLGCVAAEAIPSQLVIEEVKYGDLFAQV